ncbi:MAG TPA: serine hydrolase domain-containing protein [Kofleriaceae bacterium]|nr:serine hydrolase domain-containing protein [Kofleriaceae bacterium]
MRLVTALVLVAGCGQTPHHVAPPPAAPPASPHRAAVTAEVQPMIDNELASAIVIGLYDGGKTETYGFGPSHPDGRTLFELGAVTKVYTSLLFADSVQRREVGLDQPVAELLPTGVSVPTKDGVAITLGQLALHSSGLPRVPPSVLPNAPDPYAHYTEDTLYADLAHAQLESTPGTQITYSNWGAGLLGFALGRKLVVGYERILADRILRPLGLTDTYFTVPPAAAARRVVGTNGELARVPYWTWDALAPAGGLVSDAHDQLALIAAELEAAAGSKLPLRPAMHFTQEPQMANSPVNEGYGWQIDAKGRYWHNGGTGGFHAFIGFDPKTHRGIVILSATSLQTLDRLVEPLYDILDGKPVTPPTYPTPADLAQLAGHYDFQGSKIELRPDGKRLYVEGPGEPPIRLIPLSPRDFWIEQLQSIASFEPRDGKATRITFQIGEHQLTATRND